MSLEGAVPGPGGDGPGLIETFRWSRPEGYVLLDEHLARLAASAAALGFPMERGAVLRRLDAFAAGLPDTPRRVRLVLSGDGAVALSETALETGGTARFRVAVAPSRHNSADPWLRLKTTRRERYEQPLAAAALAGATEVLFLNERDELCEGARTNLFVLRGGGLLTPPLACGLLPGTLRAHLLARGEAEEAVLRLADLRDAPWFLGNAVRGLVPAALMAA